jgi:hypothetical protein
VTATHKRAACAVSLLACLAASACHTPPTWREADLGPVAFEDAWDGLVQIAAVDGFPLDQADTDRGHKVFASRWRRREIGFGRIARQRVHAEFERSDAQTWIVRYYVEQQKVEDLAKTMNPPDDAWESAGQDAETEQRFAAKLNMRFPPPPRQAADMR